MARVLAVAGFVSAAAASVVRVPVRKTASLRTIADAM
eukprot:CAMPEP_0171090432 /NCGR_PEP_ID=MMETSP0766_2-20121228/31017_1 /TAXON_ID=439317 /ORGANISM="Gambierdiscus australes, Strain CAWD 149" /LENGTH=36 /DNA_ID= /DNA_START= /DNA_END= /DNA_ORIENTATION=